jgi:hypothetical protein
MADFAVRGVAAEPAWPWPEGTFLDAHGATRQCAIDIPLEDDPAADVVRALAPWEGTATEPLAELNRRTPTVITRRHTWFSAPHQVSDALRRLQPSLRQIGIGANFPLARHTRRRLITLTTAPGAPSASPSIPSSANLSKDSGRRIEGIEENTFLYEEV